MTEKIIDVQNETKIDDEKKWCVYMHTSPSGKKYIGITPTEYRSINTFGEI